MGRRVGVVLLLLILSVSGAQGAALRMLDSGSFRNLVVAGRLEAGDEARVAKALDAANGVREVWLNSDGGSLETGIRIGEILRRHNMATRVRSRDVCASACVYAFLGGIIRTVEKGGKIGIHMASGAFNAAYMDALRKILNDRSIHDIDDRIRLILLVSEQYAAVAARRQARFLAEMGVSLRLLDPVFDTPHIDVYWLNAGEMRDFNVVNQ